MSLRFVAVWFAFLLLPASLPAQDAQAALTGNPVFHKDCAKCHGKGAEGKRFGGPSLGSEKTAGMSAEDLRNMIINGKGHMPSFAGRLTPEQVDELVQQIQAFSKQQQQQQQPQQ